MLKWLCPSNGQFRLVWAEQQGWLLWKDEHWTVCSLKMNIQVSLLDCHWKACLFHLKWCSKIHLKVEQQSWVCGFKGMRLLKLAISSLPVPNRLFSYWLMIGVFYGIRWNKTYCQFKNLFIYKTWASVACGRSIHSHFSLAPPHHAGHQFCHTLPVRWHPILQPQLRQCGCVGTTLAQRACPNWSHKFCGFKIRTAGRSFHLLNSQILEVVSNKPHSVEASARIFEYRVQLWRCGSATGCRISSSYLYALRLLPMMTNLGFLVMEVLHQTIKSFYCIGVAISTAFSVSSLHFDPTI